MKKELLRILGTFIFVATGIAIALWVISYFFVPTSAMKYCWAKGFTDPLGDKYCTKTVAGTDIVMSREDIEKFKDGLININTNFPKR